MKPERIVYYSGTTTGSGHIVQGISIQNGLRRNGAEVTLTLLTSSKFNHLPEQFSIPHITVPAENEHALSKDNYHRSHLYQSLVELQPDILIVDLTWFTLHHFIDELPGKKIILFRQLSPDGFVFPLLDPPLQFIPEMYDMVLATEPFDPPVPMREINPIIIRNRNEILPESAAKQALGVSADMKCCLFALNGKPGEFEETRNMYSYLEDEGYTMVYSSNYGEGLFPAVDYFNAFDLVITGGGYNAFWETRYFEKEAVHIPFPRRFESQERRIAENSDYTFDENGADQFSALITNDLMR